MKKRKICFISGSRAEYGMLYFLMKKVHSNKKLKLQLLVTGMHLSKKYGLTFREIQRDGFKIDKKITLPLLKSSSFAITKSTGTGVIKIGKSLHRMNPDLLVLVGDRFEIFAAAFAGLINRIPIAHIHGGEITKGSFDDALRHSITKMSNWHFVANKKYKKRVIQLGENPNHVFISGGLGVDTVKKTKFLKKNILEKKLKFKFDKKNLMITFHPVTLDKESGLKSLKLILRAISKLKNTKLFFTLPNADPDNHIIRKIINNFANNKKLNSNVFISLGRINYLSILKNVDAVVGNSSSGLLEAPSLKVATINIGDRQEGRLKSKSVIDCDSSEDSITKAIKKIYTKKFQKKLKKCKNPNDSGNASEKIFKIISSKKLPVDTKKNFFDLKNNL